MKSKSEQIIHINTQLELGSIVQAFIKAEESQKACMIYDKNSISLNSGVFLTFEIEQLNFIPLVLYLITANKIGGSEMKTDKIFRFSSPI